jgi:hypothetical protein
VTCSTRHLLDSFHRPTNSAVIRYTEGDCWLLAYKLGVLLDLPLVALVLADDPDDWMHLAVDLGRESLLDVLGVRTRVETLAFWEGRARGAVRFSELGRFETLDSMLDALDDVPLGLYVTEKDERDATVVASALATRFAHLVAFARD